jgi:hypothetical protein
VEDEADTSAMITVAEIATLARADTATIQEWIREEPTFPKPVANLSTGDIHDR